MSSYTHLQDEVTKKWIPLTKALFRELMGGGSGSTSVVDRELVVDTYLVTTAFAGASVNDTITCTQVIDVTSTPTTVSVIWRNQTTAADLASAPSAANISLVGAGAATATKQDTGNSSLATIASNSAVQLGSGAVTANTQRVTLASDGPAVTEITAIKNATGTTADAAYTDATGAANGTEVSLLKGVYNRLAAIATSVGVQFGAGTVTATTQRVTLASDGPEVTNSTSIKNATGTTADAAYSDGTGAAAGTNVGLLKGLFVRLASLVGIKTSANSLSATLASDDPHIGTDITGGTMSAGGAGIRGWLSEAVKQLKLLVAGTGFRVAATVTRAANTTAYTAGDVVGGVLTFSGVSSIAALIATITRLDLRWDIASVPSGMGSFRLYLYSATPPSNYADNAAWDLPAGDRSVFAGYIDIGTPVDLGSTLFVQPDGINKQMKLGAGETAIYGYLVTTAGYTPAANSETGQIVVGGFVGL